MICLMLIGAITAGPAASKNADVSATKPFVNRIKFNGNVHFSAKTLKQKMYTKESSFFAIFTKPRLKHNYLRRDIAFLEAFYHSQGYFEAKVELERLSYSKKERFVDIIIDIHEGEATVIEQILFPQSSIINTSKLRKKLMLREKKLFNPSLLETDTYTIKNEFSKHGYPAASVSDSLEYSGHSVVINYLMNSGPKINVKNVNIKGNKLTNISIIKKEITLKEGEVFNLDKLRESQRNLFDTGLFTEVELKPENIDLAGKKIDITARVRERKSTYLEIGFGVGNVLGSRVLGEWGDRNLFGTGRKLRLKAQYSFNIFKEDEVDINKLKLRTKFIRYDGEFNQRHLLGSKVLTGINAFFEKDATVEPIKITTVGLSMIANRRLSRFTDLLTSLSHERIKRESPDFATDKSTSRIFSVSISRDKRDFILNPSRGSYRSLRTQIAGGLLGGDNDFYTLTMSLQKYISLGRRTIFAVRLRTGYADAFGASAEEGVPIENRFFTGGGNSVRGYKENSLGPKGIAQNFFTPQSVSGVVGGRALLLTNAEIRYPLPYLSRINFSGAVFLDGGNVWGSLKALKIKDFRPYASNGDVADEDYRYSAGLGIRYNTPVGPIRLDYGVPIKRETGMSKNGRFHISLGQIF